MNNLVLIVDDEPDIQQQLKDILAEIPGLEIDTAGDEEAARALIAAKHYDIALLDINLAPTARGRFAGLGLQRDLQETGCITLFVSGTADDTLKSIAVIYNRYDFVSKPVIPLDLISKVENALTWTKERDREASPIDWPNGLEVDPNDRMQLFWKGQRVNLTLTQRSLVDRLARTPGVTVPYRDLTAILKSAQGSSALATHFSNIRRAFCDIDQNWNEIEAVARQGYRWKV